MSTDDRWKVEELIARYELEPQLNDVFVEGTFDREVLARAHDTAEQRRAFYEIDSVHIPQSTLDKHNLSSGNKQRIIALSRELLSVPEDAQVLCLADRDCDHWCGKLEKSSRLRWTMFCSIEAHFLCQHIIEEILVTTARARLPDIQLYVDSLCDILKSLYCLRLAELDVTGLCLTWVSLKKYLSRQGGAIAFDAERYIQALLNANGKLAAKKEFQRAYSSRLSTLTGDPRLASRGHDYSALLAWSLVEFDGQREFASTAAIERLFVLLAPKVSTIAQELQ